MNKVMQTLKDHLNLTQLTKMMIIALADAILSGFNLKIFPSGFTINLAVAILPIYYYLDRRLNPIITSWFIASIGLLFRTLTGYYVYGSFEAAFWSDFNFLFFDLLYGLVFYYIFSKSDKKSIHLLFIAASMGDFLGNTLEYITRFGIINYFDGKVLSVLFLVAIIRGTIAATLISLFNYYNSFLRKEEHDERYRSLLNIIADLRGEIYFLHRNSEHVEAVMSQAFTLYTDYDTIDDEKRKQAALEIAKNVHEIKKNYFRVIDGIDDIITNEKTNKVIKLNDICKILYQSYKRMLIKEKKAIELTFEIESEVAIVEHHLLMSVLRNLIGNAIEACEDQGSVYLSHAVDTECHVFIVRDTGRGMPNDMIQYIFNPGYSTKFNDETGNSNRGIGLTLVKDVVENSFEGMLDVTSEMGVGTVFTLTIPRKNVE